MPTEKEPPVVSLNTPPKKNVQIGLLDTIIILLLACTLVLFVLWLGGLIRGTPLIENLPDFISKAYSSIWTYLTGTGGSAVLALIRRRSGGGPRYLLWTFVSALVMLVVVFVVGYIMPQPPPDRALLKFSLKSEKRDRPNLSFFQKEPFFREPHRIAPENDGHYQEYVDLPGTGSRFFARVVRSVTMSESTDNPISPPN